MPSLAPALPLPVKPGPVTIPDLPDLTPELWAAIWPLVLEDWQARMTSAGVTAVPEASR